MDRESYKFYCIDSPVVGKTTVTNRNGKSAEAITYDDVVDYGSLAKTLQEVPVYANYNGGQVELKQGMRVSFRVKDNKIGVLRGLPSKLTGRVLRLSNGTGLYADGVQRLNVSVSLVGKREISDEMESVTTETAHGKGTSKQHVRFKWPRKTTYDVNCLILASQVYSARW